jgi:import inner membrane translocase subunit TIM23
MPQIESREREFYSHILRNRVDPAAGGSANNPVPDFYGMSSFFLFEDWRTIADAAGAL